MIQIEELMINHDVEIVQALDMGRSSIVQEVLKHEGSMMA